MRFNSKAYDKVFPRTTEVEHVESSVETFKPSETESEESAVEPTTSEVEETLLDEEPSTGKGGDADGNGNAGELNNE